MPALTWTALLAHFTAIAQRALALPRTPEGERLRDAVPHLIALQAVTHALDNCDPLPADERALGLDRADIAFRDHSAALHRLYDSPDSDTPLPDPLRHTIADARHALEAARAAGQGWLVTADAIVLEHPAELVHSLLGSGFTGDLLLASPGTTIFKSAPCAFARSHHAAPVDDQLLALITLFLGQKSRLVRGPITMRPPQVFRQFDFAKAAPARDLVTRWNADAPGQPLLLNAILAGDPQPVPLPPRHRPPTAPIPVVFDPS